MSADLINIFLNSITPLFDFLFVVRAFFADFFSSYLILFQTISGLISLALFAGIIYLSVKLNVMGDKIQGWSDMVNAGEYSKQRSVRAWTSIETRMKIGDEANVKMAIIEADKILDDLLIFSGFKGDTMADRLKLIKPAQFSRIDEIWRGHKIRNRIAHEPDYHISKGQAEEIILAYRKTFEELGLL